MNGKVAFLLFFEVQNIVFSLDKLEKWGLLTRSQTDPMRYLHNLEPAGFEQVKVCYYHIIILYECYYHVRKEVANHFDIENYL